MDLYSWTNDEGLTNVAMFGAVDFGIHLNRFLIESSWPIVRILKFIIFTVKGQMAGSSDSYWTLATWLNYNSIWNTMVKFQRISTNSLFFLSAQAWCIMWWVRPFFRSSSSNKHLCHMYSLSYFWYESIFQIEIKWPKSERFFCLCERELNINTHREKFKWKDRNNYT